MSTPINVTDTESAQALRAFPSSPAGSITQGTGSTAMPDPGRGAVSDGAPLVQQINRLSVMGAQLMDSVATTVSARSTGDLLADPAIAAWFSINDDVPREIVGVIAQAQAETAAILNVFDRVGRKIDQKR